MFYVLKTTILISCYAFHNNNCEIANLLHFVNEYCRYAPDRFRQEELALARTSRTKENPSSSPVPGSLPAAKNMGLVDLQVTTVREITRKHAAEREVNLA